MDSSSMRKIRPRIFRGGEIFKMKHLCGFVSVFAIFVTAAFAQSNGNFSASATAATCTIGAGGAVSGGAAFQLLETKISTSNGNGVTLDIRPDLVIGLFTDTKLNQQTSLSSADVGVTVCVTVDGSSAGILPTGCVNYNERFQQISSQLFSTISTCGAATSVCTINSDCLVGDTCYNPAAVPGGGTCIGPPSATVCTTTADCTGTLPADICDNPTGAASAGLCAPTATASCNFDLILSTLSAHSFDFVVQVDNKKPHVIDVTWTPEGQAAVGSASTAWCVGPGIVTVTQEKVFNNSGATLLF
jgi:hypothetical protein